MKSTFSNWYCIQVKYKDGKLIFEPALPSLWKARRLTEKVRPNLSINTLFILKRRFFFGREKFKERRPDLAFFGPCLAIKMSALI